MYSVCVFIIHCQIKAKKKKKPINQNFCVSEMVIEEVSAIQENLQIERMCRESAEALASKVQFIFLPILSSVLFKDNELAVCQIIEYDEDLHAASKVCLSPQCQTALSGTRCRPLPQLSSLLKEKHDNTVLIAETLRQKKLLGKYNRVSQFAVEEYKALQDTLDLEQDLRTEAENFARAMVVEQKTLKRQSQILMQSSSPSQALQEALSQVTKLSQDLETQRLEHQNQIKQMEDKLSSCETQRELTALQRKLELVEEEKREYTDRCAKAEVEVKDMRFTGEAIFGTTVQGQETLQGITLLTAAGSYQPTSPRSCESSSLSNNQLIFICAFPCSSLLSMIRKRRDIGTDIPMVVQDSVKTPGIHVDIRQQAVEEMMQRIKKGVQLRPVSQSPDRTRKLPSNSAIQELKGIMVMGL
uniref:Shootin-1 n=1 Tax=Monopterus albus TaxID=43700 RepID=A0A3Q3J8N5_MONAL